MTLLERVVAVLDGSGTSCALIGAAALAAAGVARSTFDVDLLTTDPSVLRPSLWAGLRAEGVSVEIRHADAADPLGGVVRIEAPAERPVDVIVGKHAWQARAVSRAHRPGAGPAIVQPRDLVLLKLYAGGTQDLWDIRELLRLPEGAALETAVQEDLEGLAPFMEERWADVR
jgi:hypothetical protein